MITLESPWRKLGAVSREVWRSEFRRLNSPMLADVNDCVEAAGPHGALALTQAFVEDKYATTGSKPQAKNPLNLRPGPGRMTPVVEVPGKGEFLVFDAFADCFGEWRRRLFDEAETYKAPPGGRGPYALAGEGVLDLIADAYCPKGPPGTPEFFNDPEAYARSLVTMLNRLDAPVLDQETDETDSTAEIIFGRVPRPTIIDKTIGDKILPNGETNGYSLLGQREGLLVGTCLHRMHGNLQGTFSHFSITAVGALTDYGVGGVLDGDRDGQIWQYNDPEGARTPWANGFGPGEGPGNDPDGMAFKQKFANESNLLPWNRRLVSIETSGFLPDASHIESDLTEAQVDSVAHLVAFWHDRIGVPWNVFPNHPTLGIRTLLFHDCFTTKNCPGDKLHARAEEITEKARAIMRKHQGGGTVITDPTRIPGIDRDLLKRWFGRVRGEDGQIVQYGPEDAIAKLWGTAGAESGRYPAVSEVQIFNDSPQQTRRYTRFADGLTIFQTTGQEPRLVQGGSGDFPSGMDAGLAARWFGTVTGEDGRRVQFDAADPLSSIWLEQGRVSGRFPGITEVQVFKDSASQTRRYARFEGGLTILTVNDEQPTLVRGNGSPFPPGMDDGLAVRWFGKVSGDDGQPTRFDEAALISKLWVAAGVENSHFPAVAEVQVFTDSPQQTRRYTRFADGLTIFETTGQQARVLRG